MTGAVPPAVHVTTIGYDLQVSMAISCIIAWLIPHLYFEFFEYSEYRIALEQQTKTASCSGRKRAATTATIRGTMIAMVIIGLVYSLSAVAIALSTQGMDRRADAIVVGKFLSPLTLAILSIESDHSTCFLCTCTTFLSPKVWEGSCLQFFLYFSLWKFQNG